MYTDEMRRAFRSLDSYCPKNFAVKVVDNDYFITIIAPEKIFMSLPSQEEKIKAIEYMIRVKKALEMHGAIVEILREGGKEN
jgi:predicted transcriptional regulator